MHETDPAIMQAGEDAGEPQLADWLTRDHAVKDQNDTGRHQDAER